MTGVNQEKTGVTIVGEPDPATGTLAEWQAYRARLAVLPRHDDNVRLAIAVAEARIARLSRIA